MTVIDHGPPDRTCDLAFTRYAVSAVQANRNASFSLQDYDAFVMLQLNRVFGRGIRAKKGGRRKWHDTGKADAI